MFACTKLCVRKKGCEQKRKGKGTRNCGPKHLSIFPCQGHGGFFCGVLKGVFALALIMLRIVTPTDFVRRNAMPEKGKSLTFGVSYSYSYVPFIFSPLVALLRLLFGVLLRPSIKWCIFVPEGCKAERTASQGYKTEEDEEEGKCTFCPSSETAAMDSATGALYFIIAVYFSISSISFPPFFSQQQT